MFKKAGLIFLSLCILVQLKGQTINKRAFRVINEQLNKRWPAEISKNSDFPYPYITAFPQLPHLFYWDTYFINKGLLASGNLKIAKQNTLNLLHVVDRFGYMGNAAITKWGMNRSQPPYLSVMVRDIYKVEHDTTFLQVAYPILKKEYSFWVNSGSVMEDHGTIIEGLQRYSHHAATQELIDLYDELSERLNLKKLIPESEKILIASRFATEAESGMDFTLRFDGHCPDFIAVDLNTLIYCLEKNLDWMSRLLKIKNQPDWDKLAKRRKELINKYCWDDKSGLYYDFNFVTMKWSNTAAVTSFQPLWAGIASKEQAIKLVKNLPYFQTPFGLTTTKAGSRDEKYQWGCLSIWAPMQLIAIDGLNRYGFNKEAAVIANSYMHLVAKNYYVPVSSKKLSKIKRGPGFIYEKYKSDGSINDDEYTANKMMGWSAAIFSYLYSLYH